MYNTLGHIFIIQLKLLAEEKDRRSKLMKGHQSNKKFPLCLRDLKTCFGILCPIIDTVGSTIVFRVEATLLEVHMKSATHKLMLKTHSHYRHLKLNKKLLSISALSSKAKPRGLKTNSSVKASTDDICNGIKLSASLCMKLIILLRYCR